MLNRFSMTEYLNTCLKKAGNTLALPTDSTGWLLKMKIIDS
jgi:hypothetical protein